jgi:hypothetical protein
MLARKEGIGEGLIWIVNFEAKGEVATCCDHDGVAAHGRRGRVLCESVRIERSGAGGRAVDNLELVAVEMERMAACGAHSLLAKGLLLPFLSFSEFFFM